VIRWAERHLNWSLMLGISIIIPVGFVTLALLSGVLGDIMILLAYTLAFLAFLTLFGWYLRRKGYRWWVVPLGLLVTIGLSSVLVWVPYVVFGLAPITLLLIPNRTPPGKVLGA